MRRAKAAGLRAGWRGDVAYLFSPWLWRTGPFVVFIAASLGLFVVVVLGAVVQAGQWPYKAANIAFSSCCGLLFFLNPALRAVLRRLRWRNGTPDPVVDGSGGWLGGWRR